MHLLKKTIEEKRNLVEKKNFKKYNYLKKPFEKYIEKTIKKILKK